MPPAAPPSSGTTQNIQSCASAQPPTNSAGPVLRAGFTEVLVTGMLIRWMSVSASPIAIGAKPAGARPMRRAHDDEQEHHGQHELRDDAGAEPVLARRVIAVAVRRKAAGEAEVRRAARDRHRAPRPR